MAIVITKSKTELKYIPTTEKKAKKPFSVFVNLLDTKVLLMLEDKVVKREGDSVSFFTGRYSFDVCKASIVGWENILDEEGKDVPFEKGLDGLPLDSTIAMLGVDLIQEISNVVTAATKDKSKIQVFFTSEEN